MGSRYHSYLQPQMWGESSELCMESFLHGVGQRDDGEDTKEKTRDQDAMKRPCKEGNWIIEESPGMLT